MSRARRRRLSVLVGALAVALTPAAAEAAPVATSAPLIESQNGFGSNDAPHVGSELTAVSQWTGERSRLTVTVSWKRCTNGRCVEVASGPGRPVPVPVANPTSFPFDSPAYTVTAADVGSQLQADVTAEDPSGRTTTSSALSPPVPPAGIFLGSTSLLVPPDLIGRSSSEAITGWIWVYDSQPGPATVDWRAWGDTSLFPAQQGTVSFAPGSDVAQIELVTGWDTVPFPTLNVHVALSGAHGAPLSAPATGAFAAGSAPFGATRNPANPLVLARAPAQGYPLRGAPLYADPQYGVLAQQINAWSITRPADAALLRLIAAQPYVARFGPWNGPLPGAAVQSYLAAADGTNPAAVPELSTYRLVGDRCGRLADSAADRLAYHNWITSFADGIGFHRAVVYLEMDSLITAGCLTRRGLATREAELRDAGGILSALPHVVVYLDAGAADAVHARPMAAMLRAAGVGRLQGFFLNSTHFDWTSREIAYGEQLSRLTGGKHFVVNTAVNGQGPLRPVRPAVDGNEVLCNPPGRGLGPLPSTQVTVPNLDAFAWIGHPGASGGRCRPGAPATGQFWPSLALDLARHADFRIR